MPPLEVDYAPLELIRYLQPNKISNAPNHPLFPSAGNTPTLPKLNKGVTEKQKTTKQISCQTKHISLFYDNGFPHRTIEELKGRTFHVDQLFGIMMLYGYFIFDIFTIKSIAGTHDIQRYFTCSDCQRCFFTFQKLPND